jgi:hypothetical protein
MPRKKLQIALEFMILYSFVLVIFLFLFALISVQRAQTLSSQIFSQEQLIAQSISVQLDRALQGGNGYSASFPIRGVIGTLNYNLIITENGAVIINANVGKQTMQAIAYSTVKNLVSNPSYLQPNTLYYSIPITNGTISIQNIFGIVCVDYQCPTSGGIAKNVSLSTQVFHAVTMNGGSSYISIPVSNSLNSPAKTKKITMEATVKLNSLISEIFEFGSSGVYGIEVGPIETEANSLPGNFIATIGSTQPGIVDCTSAPFQLKTNVWYQLVATYDGTTSTLVRYVNGKRYCFSTIAATLGSQSTTSLTFGEIWSNDIEPENDMILNAQIYNSSLSPSQVQALYQGGIDGSPINTNTLVGWWPLNGNANDYSGNGNNANVFNGPLIYEAVAPISARVTDMSGQPVANALVGFAATLGNLTTNTGAAGMVATNYTNNNGTAVAFLNQQVTNGKALVKATAYNSNSLLQSNLMGWWPLNDGQGNTISDISGNNNNGAMNGGAYWSMPNYVSSFDGVSSYVATSYLQNSITAYTLSAWVKSTSSGGVIVEDRAANSGNSITLGFGPSSCGAQSSGQVYFCDDSNGIGIGINSFIVVNDGKWHMVTGTWGASSGTSISPSQFSIYIDGQYVANSIFSVGSDKSPLTGVGGTLIGFHPVWNEFFSGSMSDVQAYNSILSPSQIQLLYQQGIAGQPVSGNIVGWWPLNGDTNDYSGYGGNGAIFGNLNQLSTSSIPNTDSNATSFLSASFNGMYGYIKATPSGSLTGSFTVVGWGKPATTAAMDVVGTRNPSDYGFDMKFQGGTKIHGDIGTGNTWITNSADASFPYSTNTLYQVAYTVTQTGYAIYVNGVQVGRGTYPSNTPLLFDANHNIFIGQSGTSAEYFNGAIANVQIYNTTLLPSQIQQLYQEGIGGLPLSRNLVAWWPLNGNANDYSWNGNNGLATNVIYAPQQSVNPYLLSSPGGYGVNFNGQNGYVNFGNVLNFGSTSFTISLWFKPVLDSTWRSLVIKRSGGGGTVGYTLVLDDTNHAYFAVEGPVGSSAYIKSTPIVNPSWHNLVAVRDKSSGKLRLYLDGSSFPEVNDPSGDLSNAANLYFATGGNVNFGKGDLSNVQIYNVALSAQQVQQLYQNGMPPSTSAMIPMSWAP